VDYTPIYTDSHFQLPKSKWTVVWSDRADLQSEYRNKFKTHKINWLSQQFLQLYRRKTEYLDI